MSPSDTGGLPNVIDYKVTYRVPKDYEQGLFEIITPYMETATVSKLYAYNPVNKASYYLPSIEHKANYLPLIAASEDGQYAMGIYAPDIDAGAMLPYNGNYMRHYSDRVIKTNAFFKYNKTPKGDYNFQSFVVIGSFQQVKDSISAVHRMAHGGRGHIDGFVETLSTSYLSGWACQGYNNKPIGIHLYLGGPAGKGTFAGSYRAYQKSELAVAVACGTNRKAHRF